MGPEHSGATGKGWTLPRALEWRALTLEQIERGMVRIELLGPLLAVELKNAPPDLVLVSVPGLADYYPTVNGCSRSLRHYLKAMPKRWMGETAGFGMLKV